MASTRTVHLNFFFPVFSQIVKTSQIGAGPGARSEAGFNIGSGAGSGRVGSGRAGFEAHFATSFGADMLFC